MTLVLSLIGLLLTSLLLVGVVFGLKKLLKLIRKTHSRENVRSEECSLCNGMFAPNYIGMHVHECSSSLCPMPRPMPHD